MTADRKIESFTNNYVNDIRLQKHNELCVHSLKRPDLDAISMNNYMEITEIYKEVLLRFLRKSILISGSAEVYGDFGEKRAVEFLHDLSKDISRNSYKIISGFGWGVGSAIINGVHDKMEDENTKYIDNYLIMRPFPQFETKGKNTGEFWTEYRKNIIHQAGIAVFVFGNRKNKISGEIEPASGMIEEFKIALSTGPKVIPVGATGFVARELWEKVMNNFESYYPNYSDLKDEFIKLGDTGLTNEELINSIIKIIDRLNSQ